MKLKYVLIAAGLAITLIILLGVRLALQDSKAATASLVEMLTERFPQAQIGVDGERIMTVVQPNGYRQRFDTEDYIDLCSRLPGTCDRERERVVDAFARNLAEGPVVDGRLRPYLLPTAKAADGQIVDPLVGDLSIGYAFFTEEVMLVLDKSLVEATQRDAGTLRAEAIANLDQVEAAPRLRPIMLVHGVAEMVATPDAAAQVLSRPRMKLLASTLGEDRFYFALPRNGVMLVARAIPSDRKLIDEVLQQTFNGSANHVSDRLYLYEAGAFKDAPAP
ncbi:hypothetical protein BH10PSE17_BH10PSE17_08380 [soil metagenome]